MTNPTQPQATEGWRYLQPNETPPEGMEWEEEHAKGQWGFTAKPNNSDLLDVLEFRRKFRYRPAKTAAERELDDLWETFGTIVHGNRVRKCINDESHTVHQYLFNAIIAHHRQRLRAKVGVGFEEWLADVSKRAIPTREETWTAAQAALLDS